MAIIELTDAQRQALQGKQARPVDVIDPATKKAYVLLAREEYERVRPLLEGGAGEPPPSEPPPPASGTPESRPLRQRIRDLPLPPEVAVAAERYCKRLGLWRKKSRLEVEEQMKLQHYYGSTWIAVLRSAEGPVVVAAAKCLSDPVFDQQLSFLTEEERRRRVLECPVKLFDDESEILTVLDDES
jgi:hypothetical protein